MIVYEVLGVKDDVEHFLGVSSNEDCAFELNNSALRSKKYDNVDTVTTEIEPLWNHTVKT